MKKVFFTAFAALAFAFTMTACSGNNGTTDSTEATDTVKAEQCDKPCDHQCNHEADSTKCCKAEGQECDHKCDKAEGKECCKKAEGQEGCKKAEGKECCKKAEGKECEHKCQK